MKKYNILFFLILGFLTTIQGQTKKITVEDIYQGAFQTEGLQALRSMQNGKQYTILNRDRSSGSTQIDLYDNMPFAKVKHILSSADFSGFHMVSS